MDKCFRILPDLEQGTEEWLRVRTQHITATEIAHLWCGKESFESLRDLKTGVKTAPDLSGNKSVQEGKFFEPLIRAKAYELWHDKLFKGVSEIPTPCVERLDEPFFMASLDGLIPNGCPIEIKNTCSTHDYSDARLNGIHNKIARQYGYYAQVQWQLFVTGAPCCLFLQHHSEDGRTFCDKNFCFSMVNRDEKVIAELIKLGKAFKEYLYNGTEPKDLVVNGRVFFASAGDEGLKAKLAAYRSVNEQYERLSSELKALRESRASLTEEICQTYIPDNLRKVNGDGYTLAKVERKGSIDAEALCSELLEKGLITRELIEKFRKESSFSYSVKLA